MNIIKHLLRPLSFLPAILIMYLIFSFSAQDGVTSAELSYKISYEVVELGGEILDADLQPWEIESYAQRFHGPIRKLAHMAEYFALAVAMSFPLYVYGLRGIWLMLVSGILCVGFACADEYHQSMVAGRMPSKKDVAIDSFGIFWGIVLVRIVGWTGRKTIFRPFCKKKKEKRSSDYMPDMMQAPYPPAQYSATQHSVMQHPAMQHPTMQHPTAQHSVMQHPTYNRYTPDNPSAASVYPPNYPVHPNRRRPSGNQPPRPNRPYPNRPYNGVPGPYAPYQQYQQQKSFTPAPAPVRPPAEEASFSDSLSEDMSIKKLMHDIKDQKKAAYADMKHAWKPSVDGTDVPEDDNE